MQSKVHESKGIDFSQPEKIKQNEEGHPSGSFGH